MLTVQIVITCFTEKRWSSILEAIHSAREQTYQSDVVVVVDHNEALLARLKSESLPGVAVIPNKFARGASGARNTGGLAASGDLIAFLEDDAVAAPTWIEQLVKALARSPSAVGVGGQLVPAWQTARPPWFPAEFNWTVGGSYHSMPGSEPKRVRNVWSGNMLVKRLPFIKVDGFRVGFGKRGEFAEPEDTELCIRMTSQVSNGYWIFAPNALVWHIVPAERATWLYFMRRCWSEGKGKAALASSAGDGVRALTEEIRFVLLDIPRAIYQNVADSIRGDLAGLSRAAAIFFGALSACVGFSAMTVSRKARSLKRRVRGRSPRGGISGRSKVPASDAGGSRETSTQRVCVVGSGWHFLSGISYYTCHLANALAERHQTSAILMRRLLPARLYPGRSRVGAPLARLTYRDDVPVFNGVDWFWGRSIVHAIRFLRRERPDVLVFQWWTGTVLHSYLLLAWIARRMGARLVIEFHELQDTGEVARPFARAYVRLLIGRLARMASGFVVHSHFDQEALQRTYATPSRPTVVAPHGPYEHHNLPEPAGRSAGGVCNVLFFGTIRPYKGLEDLVRAFDGLGDGEVQNIQLTVVGETWEGWELPAELIAQARHRDRITFVNRYVTDEELSGFLACADAVVVPYHRASASGPLHIAMSQGLPVIVTTVGGLVEAAREYAGAEFVPPRDVHALQAAIRNLPARAGQRYPDPHSWQNTVQKLDTLFSGIFGASPSSTAGETRQLGA